MANEEWGHLAVDWPKKQVERIDGTLEEMAQSVVEVEARATDLEDRLREAEQRVRMARRKLEDLDRDRQELGLRVRKLEGRLEIGDPDDETEPFEVWTERQLDKLAVAVRELQNDSTCVTQALLDRIGRLELFDKQTDEAFDRLQQKHRTLVESQNDWTQQFGERLVEVEGALRDYGIPLGAPSKTEAFARMYGTSPTGRGFVKGVDPRWAGPPMVHTEHVSVLSDAGTLDEAEERVRQYLVGRVPNALIVGVVRALRNDETYGGRLPLGHLFRFNSGAADKTKCSHRVGGRGNPCDRPASDH